VTTLFYNKSLNFSKWLLYKTALCHNHLHARYQSICKI